jgi:hypothetical protein
MFNRLEEKVQEVLVQVEERFPHLEIRSFDYNVLKDAVSLVEDISHLLGRFCRKEKYRFTYRFVFPINREGFLIFDIKLSITSKKFTHTLGMLHATGFPRLKPSEKEKGALFVMFFYTDTHCYILDFYNALQRLATTKNLYFRKGFETGVGYKNPFPDKGYYSFEIPFNVEVLEYII